MTITRAAAATCLAPHRVAPSLRCLCILLVAFFLHDLRFESLRRPRLVLHDLRLGLHPAAVVQLYNMRGLHFTGRSCRHAAALADAHVAGIVVGARLGELGHNTRKVALHLALRLHPLLVGGSFVYFGRHARRLMSTRALELHFKSSGR